MQLLLIAYLLFVLFYLFASFFAILQIVRFSITTTLMTFLLTLYVVGTLSVLLLSTLVIV